MIWEVNLQKQHRNIINDILSIHKFSTKRSAPKEREGNVHKVYLQLWKFLEEQDREISIMFDDLKRSNAIHKLAAWKHNNVISDKRFAEFSDETQENVKALSETLR